MSSRFRPTFLVVIAYAALSVSLFAAWNLWERLVGLAVAAVVAATLEYVASRAAGNVREQGDRVVVKPPTWFQMAMWLGVLAGLAGTIGGGISLIVEWGQATLVGPLASPVVMVVFLRFARMRVEVRGESVIVANVGSSQRVLRGQVTELQRDRGEGPARRRLRLLLVDGRRVDVGISGAPDLPTMLLSSQDIDRLTDVLAEALGLEPVELTDAVEVATQPPSGGVVRTLGARQIVGALGGLALGVFGAPSGALVLAALGGFIWAMARLFRDAMPHTAREARRRARDRPAAGGALGSAVAYQWAAPAMGPFVILSVLSAVTRIALRQ